MRDFYGERLVSAVIFGSIGRNTPNYDSDVDILIIAENLPCGRMERIREFGHIESKMEPEFDSLKKSGINSYLSPVIKSVEEASAGSPLFLDMTEDSIILYDRDMFFKNLMDALKKRLGELGAKRVFRANAFFWDLKPDYKPKENIII